MKRELQKLNVIATLCAFVCAAVSFFFISYNDLSVISIVNSALLIVFTIALFFHGVILPSKGIKLDEKTRRKMKVFLVLGMLFAEDKFAYAELYEDLSPDMVFRRTWSPWTMFSMLVVGLLTGVPALYLNSNRYYELCILGFAFFFLVLFIISFIYQYYQRKENEDEDEKLVHSFNHPYHQSGEKEEDKLSKTVRRMFWALFALCVIGFFVFVITVTYNDPIYITLRQVEQWKAFKTRQEKIYNDELPGGMVTGFTEEEQGEFITALEQKYGKDVLYKVVEKDFFEKDDKNRYYRELTLAAAMNDSDDVYIYIYRKYLSENDEYEKDKAILFTSFKSETMKKEDVFSQKKTSLPGDGTPNPSVTTVKEETDRSFKTNNCRFDDEGKLLVMGENGYEPYTYEEFPGIPANLSKIIQVLDEGGNYLKLDYQDKKLFLYYALEDGKSQIIGGNGIDIFNFNIDTEQDIVSFSVEALTFYEYLEDDYRPHLLETFNLLFGESGKEIYDYLMTFYDQGLEDGTTDETFIDGMKITYRLTPKHRLTIYLNPRE